MDRYPKRVGTYDGYKPKVYKFGFENPYEAMIYSVYKDRKGELWVASPTRLFRYDRANDHFTQVDSDIKTPQSLSSRELQFLHDDQYDNLWIMLWDDGKEENLINRLNIRTGQLTSYSKQAKGILATLAGHCKNDTLETLTNDYVRQ